jgi:hypothetical protein
MSDSLTGRFKRAGREAIDQVKEITDRVINETTEALTSEVEREGLTPAQIAQRLRAAASHVRDAVTQAVQHATEGK